MPHAPSWRRSGRLGDFTPRSRGARIANTKSGSGSALRQSGAGRGEQWAGTYSPAQMVFEFRSFLTFAYRATSPVADEGRLDACVTGNREPSEDEIANPSMIPVPGAKT